MIRISDEYDGRANEIEQQAAEWVARIDLHGTPEDWSALDAWLNSSPRHRAAFLRLSVAWRRADELKALAPRDSAADPDLLDPARWQTEPSDEDGDGSHARQTIAQEQPAPDEDWAAARVYRSRNDLSTNEASDADFTWNVAGDRFRAIVTSRVAAAVALFAAAGLGALGVWYAVEQSDTQTYSTHVGEFHRVTLADGSTIALNTDSEVRVHYTSRSRHVDLTRGEALFKVAKNKERPFDVEAGHTTVRAVGTAFSVRLHESSTNERVDLVVSEGRIAINPPSAQTYVAGSVAKVSNGRVESTLVDSVDITNRLEWTNGRLMFQGEKLSDVVEEINRYNVRKLQVKDADIAELRIGGVYQATDPDGFARMLRETFGVKSHLVPKSFGPDVIELDSGVP